jgi:predicted nucleic acid-binding protein
MGQSINLFFDTYAFFEVLEKKKSYLKYTKEVIITTTKLNLMKLHYGILRTHGKEKADLCYDELLSYAVDVSDEIIKSANQFRFLMKKRKLSYVDCIGYVLAQSLGIKFLTGDNGFVDLANVKFVK